MRLWIALIVAGLVSISVLGAQQPHNAADNQQLTVGKIAWQYETGG
jgi:hypothetical protein